MDALIELPKKGSAIIITDLHGRFDILNRIIDETKIVERLKKDYLIVTGDLIHSYQERDESIEILEFLVKLKKENPNVFILLGNHEWSHITNIPVYKGAINQYEEFLALLKKRI